MSALSFELIQQDASSHARLGRVRTCHGTFDTPAFMPVGTQGTIKGFMPDQIHQTGAQIVLGNTYHLMLRPGADLIQKMGGLQKWTRWQGPMLTDSGGFQVFSLADINKINEAGVRFKSHLDGAMIDLTPERSMQVQNALGADIIMAFDDCPPSKQDEQQQTDVKPVGPKRHAIASADYDARLKLANERTLRWLDRCVKAHQRTNEQSLFGIVQGGTDLAQREQCVKDITAFDLPGYAIGGVAVGEGPDEIRRVVEHTAPQLPTDRPRYLMGVGYARDIVTAVRAGVDMFDCVLPTRNGRNANAFTRTGQIRLRNAVHCDVDEPIEQDCACPVCAGGYSRSYIRHLFLAEEMLGPILVSLHNLHHFQRLMLDIRAAIAHNDWSSFASGWPIAFADGSETGL